MQRLILAGVLVCGCKVENPEFLEPTEDGSGEGGSVSTAPTTSSGTTGVTSEETGATTAGDGSATDSGTSSGESTTTGGVSGSTSTTGAPTTGEESTSEGTSGDPPPDCGPMEIVPLDVPGSLISDTGMAPASMVDCLWGGKCAELNFGETEFYRLMNKPEFGKNSAIIRFDVGSLAEIAAAQGREIDDIHGFVLSLVVYEDNLMPMVPTTLEVAAPLADNVMFQEGVRQQTTAMDGDSSELCKGRILGECIPWAEDKSPTLTSTPLGTIEVTAQAAMENDYDQDPNRYHAELKSSLLPISTIRAVSGDGPPTFVVSLITERGANPEKEFGIKLEDSGERDPKLLVVMCSGG